MAEKRVKVAVAHVVGAKFLYGFSSPNKDEASNLGLVLVETVVPDKDVAFSPKNVKPFSAYRPGILAKGGLCDVSKVAALETLGYQISRKNPSTPKGGPKSVIVGVRLSDNLVFCWRYKKSAWDALPLSVRIAAGVALASIYPAGELAFHADGVIFAAPNTDLDLPAGVYIGKSSLRRSFSATEAGNNKTYTLYAGKAT